MLKEQYEIQRMIEEARQKPEVADSFIKQYMPFVKAETAKYRRECSFGDGEEELSIAMFAFYEALTKYQVGKGAFFQYASIVIRSRLIDFGRRERHHGGVVSLDEPMMEGENALTLADKMTDHRDAYEELEIRSATKKEIEEFREQLNTFGLSLSDIADSCPRQERTFSFCMQALDYARKNPNLIQKMIETRKLPIMELANGAHVSRKTLERHRRYMMAILLAYTNGFEIIRGHLCQIKRKEGAEK